jgi:hypothetical protein
MELHLHHEMNQEQESVMPKIGTKPNDRDFTGHFVRGQAGDLICSELRKQTSKQGYITSTEIYQSITLMSSHIPCTACRREANQYYT